MEKKRFIQIIGSDGAGKSTIARSLQNVLGYEVKHFGPVKSYKEGRDEYFHFVRDLDTNIITDRFFEGEVIYAPIYRGYRADYIPVLEMFMNKFFNPLLILCDPGYDVIVERLNERGEDFVKPEHYKQCYDGLQRVYDNSFLPKMIIDTSEPVQKNVEKIMKQLFING